MDYLFHIGVIAGIYVILAQSLNLIVGYTGQAALGHAGFYCLGAYASALLSLHFDIAPLLSTIGAACIGGAAGVLVSYPSIRLKGDYLALATFGAGVIVYSIAMNWVSVTRGSMGLPGIPLYTVFAATVQSPIAYFALVAGVAALTMATVYRIVRSPFGRVLQAIRDDEIAPMALGKNVARYKIAGFGVGGMFAGVAGALYAHYVGFIDPTNFTSMESIAILLMVVIGGMGTLPGPIIGATVLVAFPELLRFLDVSSSIAGPLRQMLYSFLLIVLMMRRPQGLMLADPGPQLEKVLAFRKSLEDSRQVLYRLFADEKAFAAEVDRHLRAYAKGELPKADAPPREAVVLPLQYLQEVTKAKAEAQAAVERAEAHQKHAEAQATRADKLALELAEQGAAAAQQGQVEQARQTFARAHEGTTNLDRTFLSDYVQQ
jgi:branched-chain amino acid transport system permease protein